MFFSYGANFLHNKMGIVPTEIMENNRQLKIFWINPQLQSTVLVSTSAVQPVMWQ